MTTRPFFPYLWFLLPKPLKAPEHVSAPGGGRPRRHGRDENEIERTVQVLASLLDDLKSAVFSVRSSWVTASAEGQALDLIGADRMLRRIPGESDDDYRARLLAAFDLYQQGGTLPGMKLAMELVGEPEAEVEEPRVPAYHDGTLHRDGGAFHGGWVSWARFMVKLALREAGLPADHLATVLRQVDEWKPAHTMLAHLVLDTQESLSDEVPVTTDSLALGLQAALSDLYAWPGLMHNGAALRDGTHHHDGAQDTLQVEVIPA
jgi:hypothetical protein